MVKRGKLITFEGGEGCGKSTQLVELRRAIDALGIEHVDVREPGGTATGERIRALLLDPATLSLSARAELLLYEAARAQIVDEVIQPALADGKNVICDRFYDSTMAYQGFGRGLDKRFIKIANLFATQGLVPDLTVFFDIEPNLGLARATGQGADRLEGEDIEFHRMVREGFCRAAEREPRRFRVIDADSTIPQVHREVLDLVLPLLLEG